MTRRDVLGNCVVRGLLVAGTPMSANCLFGLWQATEKAAAKATPEEVLGPFFKKNAPNNKVLRAANDPGIPLRVTGNVVNTKGEPVHEAQVDLWQTDHHGRYDLQGYRYRTKLNLQGTTRYEVDTVMPGHYADRPAQHIHYLITAPGHKLLVTQLYFATDHYFEGDPDRNHAKGGVVGNRDLIRPVTLYEQPGAAHTSVNFDIVLVKA